MTGPLVHNVTAALRLDAQRSMARIGLADPDTPECDGFPSEAAVYLASIVYPEGGKVLNLIVRDERHRRYRAEKIANCLQLFVVGLGFLAAGFIPSSLYYWTLRVLEARDFHPWGAPLLGVAMASAAFAFYYPFACHWAEPPTFPVSIDDYMPAGPGDIALNFPVRANLSVGEVLESRRLQAMERKVG